MPGSLMLLKAGIPVHVVAARLGHADPAITLRVHTRLVLADPLANRPSEKSDSDGPSR
jgi:hypothetical protein